MIRTQDGRIGNQRIDDEQQEQDSISRNVHSDDRVPSGHVSGVTSRVFTEPKGL
ncbi:hypothetical protein [Haladaptatus cibarius]|uniref:hypothetical protein n=1 Tax=Haladaptatus cibarius TaxID=453847 RepID=UPI000AF9C21F|nr:hypothetical protein [Haladaptatus cibarius]